jgi:hypothetical protein
MQELEQAIRERAYHLWTANAAKMAMPKRTG